MGTFGQTVMIFEMLKKHGPLGLEELAEKIRSEYGPGMNRYMLSECTEHTGILESRMRIELCCLVKGPDERYTLDMTAKRYAFGDDIERFLRDFIKLSSEEMRERLRQPDCENTKIEL